MPSLSVISNTSSRSSIDSQGSSKKSMISTISALGHGGKKLTDAEVKEQEERFWDILVRERVVNRERSINGQDLLVVQKKIVRNILELLKKVT